MRFLLAILLTAALAFLAGLILPWWSIAPVAFLVALLLRPGTGAGFFAGFLGIFLCWTAVAAWIDARNGSLLSGKVAQLLPLGGSALLLILVTASVGGLVGGFAALAGSSVRRRRI